MGVYNDLISNSGNGTHIFDANLIDPTLLAGATISNVRAIPVGELVDVTAGGGFSLPNVTIHFRGRVGVRDFNLDLIILTTSQLAALSNPRQNYAIAFERVPLTVNNANPGRRVGVTRPPRGDA